MLEKSQLLPNTESIAGYNDFTLFRIHRRGFCRSAGWYKKRRKKRINVDGRKRVSKTASTRKARFFITISGKLFLRFPRRFKVVRILFSVEVNVKRFVSRLAIPIRNSPCDGKRGKEKKREKYRCD